MLRALRGVCGLRGTSSLVRNDSAVNLSRQASKAIESAHVETPSAPRRVDSHCHRSCGRRLTAITGDRVELIGRVRGKFVRCADHTAGGRTRTTAGFPAG